MKTNVRDTSLEASFYIRGNGIDLNQKGVIYKMIMRHKGLTRLELSVKTGIPINAVCGRVKELMNGLWIKEGPARKCKVSGRTAAPLYVD